MRKDYDGPSMEEWVNIYNLQGKKYSTLMHTVCNTHGHMGPCRTVRIRLWRRTLPIGSWGAHLRRNRVWWPSDMEEVYTYIATQNQHFLGGFWLCDFGIYIYIMSKKFGFSNALTILLFLGRWLELTLLCQRTVKGYHRFTPGVKTRQLHLKT